MVACISNNATIFEVLTLLIVKLIGLSPPIHLPLPLHVELEAIKAIFMHVLKVIQALKACACVDFLVNIGVWYDP